MTQPLYSELLDSPPIEPAAAAVHAAAHAQLLRAVRMVIRADSDPARQALFASLMQSRVWVRVAFELHEKVRGTWGSAFLVGIFGLAALLTVAPPRHRRARLLGVAEHVNARRQVRRVFSWVGAGDCALLRTGAGAVTHSSSIAALADLIVKRRLGQALRIIRRIDGRHGFLVACRAAAAIAWYARSHAILRTHRPGAVLVSSDSNPEEVGVLAAARVLGIPQIFVSHAYPTPLSPPLDFTLSILEGEAAVRARRRKGPIRGDVFLAGVEGDSAPLDARRFERPRPTIGIFTSKALSWDTLAAIVADCRDVLDAGRIVIRWHPNMLEQPRLAHRFRERSRVVESPRAAALADVVRECDWVIADENSNVHLPVLKLGVPTIAISRMGVYPASRADQYGFVANGIVYPPLVSLRDVNVPALLAFFDDGWRHRFQQYDAAYLRPSETVGREVRRAIHAVIDGAATTAASR